MCALASHIVPGQRAPDPLGAPNHPQLKRWIGVQEAVFFAVADLLNLEVDVLLF